MKQYFILFVLMLLIAPSLFARQNQPLSSGTVLPPKMEPGLLKEDFSFFREALQKNHTGLYRYKSKAQLDKMFDSCYGALDHPMTQLEFGKTIMFIISFFQDGHTGTDLPRLMMNYYRENEKMFPAYVYFASGKAYILCGVSNGLPVGTEILSIDNKPVSKIKRELSGYLPSDGSIETKKTQTINDGAFPFMYNWIYGNKASFTVTYKTAGENKTASINAAFVKEIECNIGNKAGNAMTLEFPENNTALLTIRTFDENRLGGRQGFTGFMDSSLNEINAKKTGTLIIDVRNNGGGADELGALLYAYLAIKPFKYFLSVETNTHQFQVNENPLLGIQQPQKNSFAGKVLVLINGSSFSTTADFCAMVRSNNRGLFIGEETGGGYYGNTSGQSIPTQLPNSKINIRIPTWKYVNDVKKASYADRGIIPDFIITPSVNEILQHTDVQLDRALLLSKEK